MKDGYPDKKKKIGHFALGFGINLGIAAAHFYSYFLLASIYSWAGIKGDAINTLGALLLLAVIIFAEFFLIRYFFRSGKRYIAIGMLSALIVPLLVSGFCTVFFANMGNLN